LRPFPKEASYSDRSVSVRGLPGRSMFGVANALDFSRASARSCTRCGLEGRAPGQNVAVVLFAFIRSF